MARDVYESLNEQLTTEIPQLIDLRVPYLDPSFEALVKIQLRCMLASPGYWKAADVSSLCGSVLENGAGTTIP